MYDRFDIVEAHYWYCVNYHTGQWSPEYARQCRIGRYFSPGLHGDRYPSTSNGRWIASLLVRRHFVNGEPYGKAVA